MNEEFMAFIAGLPPEQQQQFLAQMQGGGQQDTGMPPIAGIAPQQSQEQPVDPRMGMPGSQDTFRNWEGEGEVIADQQAQAEALRGTAMPQGMQTQNAGFVASNPMSHVATAVKQWQGRQAAKESLAAKTKLAEDLALSDKTDSESELRRKTGAEEMMAQELRRNRRGSPLDQMAGNQTARYSA